MSGLDAVVVGSGPNGLAAAVVLARAGLAVRLYEGEATVGGAARTAELTLPGFRHDIGSAVHPMALASEFFRSVRITERVAFEVPEVSYAHVLGPGRAAVAYRDLRRTADELGVDGVAWRRLFGPLVERERQVSEFTGGALLRVPRAPDSAAVFGVRVLEQGGPAWNARFRGEEAPALLAGLFAHASHPLPSIGAAAAGLVLGMHAHARGWPVPVGGSQSIADALVDLLREAGGEIVTSTPIRSLGDLPPSRVVLLDTTAPAFARLAGSRLTASASARYRRVPFGNGVAKLDVALSGPVPWADARLSRTATVHLGGTRAQIAASEREVAAGRVPDRPYVLVAQPSILDPSRAPEGRHTLWAYTHVPAGSTADRTEAMFAALEEAAPGFRDLVLGTAHASALDVARIDPNLVGGDIGAGSVDTWRLVARPRLSPTPWATPLHGVYLCSAATAPGPGVHGMAGYHAARTALRREFGMRRSPAPE